MSFIRLYYTLCQRYILSGIIAVLLIGLLAACAPITPPPSTGSADSTATTRTITHAYGTTEVPIDPQRVVSVGYETHEFILNFGIVPVLLRDYTGGQPDGIWPWAQPLLGGAHPETFTEEMPFEKIAAAQPDLIISVNGGLDQAAYDRLSQIAPTIPHQEGTDEWTGINGDWQDRILWYGEIFGQQEKAQEQIDEILARLEEIKAAHPEWEGMEAVSVTEWEAFHVDVTHPRGQLLESFGFVIPEEFSTESQVAYEDIQKLDRDILLWINGADDATPVLDNKLRDTLTAHVEGREIYVDKYLTQALSNQSPAAWGYVLDTLPDLLEAAADGDPSTPVSSSVEAGVAP